MKQALFILGMLTILFAASCQKVVNIDLNEADPQYVIIGNLYEGTNPFSVQVALTTDYYGREPQTLVNDALVTLYDEAGTATPVPSTGNGNYELPSFTAVSGKTYQLKVIADGREFTATTTMPRVVPIDSISIEWNEASGFQEEGYDVAAHFTDPAGERNFYRIIRTENDTLRNEPDDLYLLEDDYNDGKPVIANFFNRYRKGEKIEVELLTMDQSIYEFYTSLRAILNNQNGPAPANPNTNIRGGALGYFGAFTSSKASVQLP